MCALWREDGLNMIHICGSFTHGQKKPCKTCKHFWLWGVSTGHCFRHKVDMMIWEHCKYHKRDARIWTKDGKCKFDEHMLYV
jgi:hypothetical protein